MSHSPISSPLTPPISAESLNRGCTCRTLDQERLRRQLEAEPSLTGLADEIGNTRPHLFSATAVFVSADQLQRMTAIVDAVEQVAAIADFQHQALARAPAIAQQNRGPLGVFMGFDFHLSPAGPQLIEINTNAGGALLNLALAHAQEICCEEIEGRVQPTADLATLDRTFFEMFTAEWQRQRGDAPLTRVAIVDNDPTNQYLYPEFQLFERLFRRFGVAAVIADPQTLIWRDGRLWHEGEAIDLVYNRLTDFYLESPRHEALRAAYEAGDVVLTPHPYAHAIYADKRNLITLSDDATLIKLGVSDAARAALIAGVPRTELVSREKADDLWSRRRNLFFKPESGFGSRAAYRGDKLTKRVWEEIIGGGYVAQTLAPPSERVTRVEETDTELKLDVRVYTYAGKPQLIAARLYSGQTTNFRTPGGGFAPVFITQE